PTLFQRLVYENITESLIEGSLPKMGGALEVNILRKVLSQTKTLSFFSQRAGEQCIYYTRKLSGFVQILDFIPTIFDARGKKREPSELKQIVFGSQQIRDIFLALL